MSFHITIHSRPRSKDSTTIWINLNMTPKDVIQILRVQTNIMKNSDYGLMVSKTRNKCKWLSDDEEFGKIIIDENDIVFVQPFHKLITIELPDHTCVKKKVDMRSPTQTFVKELCFNFNIYPYEIWGAYIDARGEKILIIPNQSISEQAPEVDHIYLKQYLFPENLKPEVLSPLNLYILQYRSMIIQEQFGNNEDDKVYLKGKGWFNSKNITNGLPHSENSKKKELNELFSLKNFGSVSFPVRFHETVGKENSHSYEKVKQLTIVRKALFLNDINGINNDKLVVPFSAIKYVGIRDDFLKITFGSKEWHFISHRSSEIDVIICQLMKNYHFTIPLKDIKSDIFLPRLIHSQENTVYSLPDKIYTTEELIIDNMYVLAHKYAKLVKLQNESEYNEDFTLTEIGVNTALDELMNVVKKRCNGDNAFQIDLIKSLMENAKLITAAKIEDKPIYLEEIRNDLLKLNEVLNKLDENTEYRHIKKIIKKATKEEKEPNELIAKSMLIESNNNNQDIQNKSEDAKLNSLNNLSKVPDISSNSILINSKFEEKDQFTIENSSDEENDQSTNENSSMKDVFLIQDSQNESDNNNSKSMKNEINSFGADLIRDTSSASFKDCEQIEEEEEDESIIWDGHSSIIYGSIKNVIFPQNDDNDSKKCEEEEEEEDIFEEEEEESQEYDEFDLMSGENPLVLTFPKNATPNQTFFIVNDEQKSGSENNGQQATDKQNDDNLVKSESMDLQYSTDSPSVQIGKEMTGQTNLLKRSEQKSIDTIDIESSQNFSKDTGSNESVSNDDGKENAKQLTLNKIALVDTNFPMKLTQIKAIDDAQDENSIDHQLDKDKINLAFIPPLGQIIDKIDSKITTSLPQNNNKINSLNANQPAQIDSKFDSLTIAQCEQSKDTIKPSLTDDKLNSKLVSSTIQDNEKSNSALINQQMQKEHKISHVLIPPPNDDKIGNKKIVSTIQNNDKKNSTQIIPSQNNSKLDSQLISQPEKKRDIIKGVFVPPPAQFVKEHSSTEIAQSEQNKAINKQVLTNDKINSKNIVSTVQNDDKDNSIHITPTKQTNDLLNSVQKEDTNNSKSDCITCQKDTEENKYEESLEIIDNNQMKSGINQEAIENNENDEESSEIIICSPLIQRSNETKSNSNQISKSGIFSPTKKKHEMFSNLTFFVQDEEGNSNENQKQNGYSASSFQNNVQQRYEEFPIEVYDGGKNKQSYSASLSKFRGRNTKYTFEETSDLEMTPKENMMKFTQYNEEGDKVLNGQNNLTTSFSTINNNYYQQSPSQTCQQQPMNYQSSQHFQFQMNTPPMQQQQMGYQYPSQSLQPQQFQSQMHIQSPSESRQLQMQQVSYNSPSQSLQQQQFQLQLQQQQLASQQIPVPCFGQMSSQFVPFNQSIVSGYPLSPGAFYSPSPSASPSTHIETSPQITVNVSGSKRRKSKTNRKSAKKRREESDSSDSYSDYDSSSEYDSCNNDMSESDDECETTDALIQKIESQVDKIIKASNSHQKARVETKDLKKLLSQLERKYDGSNKGNEISTLIKKVKKFIKKKSNKKQEYIELADEITKTLRIHFAEFIKSLNSPIIRRNKDIIVVAKDESNFDELQKTLLDLQNSFKMCDNATGTQEDIK